MIDETINHPAHYGGDTPYEAIKVIKAWGLGFSLGNAVKYISRAGKKGGKDKRLEDLRKALWYLEDEIGAHSAPMFPDVGYEICGKKGPHGQCVLAQSHQSLCRNSAGDEVGRSNGGNTRPVGA
jgi:hypothetical protein